MGLFARFKIGAKSKWTPAEFWDWFQSVEGQATVSLVALPEDRRSKEAQVALYNAIKRVHPDLVWGLKPQSDDGSAGVVEISAGGMKELIPVVESLVDAAPDMKNWQVIAFKQPMQNFSLTLGASGESIDSNCVMVNPIPLGDGRFDLDVFVPTPAGFPKKAVSEIGFIVLDHTLGEFNVMTRIAGLQFESILVAPSGVISIAEFATQLQS